MVRGEIMPTDPRLDWDVVEAVSIRKLRDVLKTHSERGWIHYAFLRSAQLGKWDVVFMKIEQIGERDRVEELIQANPPYHGAQRVND